MEWKPDRLLVLILLYVILSGFMFWLPIIRGLFDGPTYTWSGWMGLGGSGIGGQYWLLLILVSLMTSIVILGWRGAQKPFHWLLLTWFILLVIESGSWFFSSEKVHFKGDTLGLNFSLEKIIFPFDVFFLVLTCLWIIRDKRSTSHFQSPSWKRLNRNLLIVFFCFFPIQLVLLRFFDNNRIFDQIGVILTIFQWILLNLSFYPWQSRKPQKSPSRRS
ncbi:hypothetical protein [Neobacillus rhizophilus]|uniref:Uncharacterized protein n=1 Tax=Neobacillus rhizophilus TaxID=2833579 RepID=A0A942YW35_9BACI|nr:hypothetical protein [Neobacillus rhizophilus]MBS4214557.1 hypothetical protein [Neobacillus rhizophilus]